MSRHRFMRAALAGLLLAAGLGTVAARAQDCANHNDGVSVLQGCDTLIDLDVIALGEQTGGGGGGSGTGSGSNTNEGISVAQLSHTDVDLNLVSTDDEGDSDAGGYDCTNKNDGLSVVQACDTDISISVIGSGSEEDGTSSVSPGQGSGSNDNSGLSVAQLSGTEIDIVLLNLGRNGGTDPGPPGGGIIEPPGEDGGSDPEPPSGGGGDPTDNGGDNPTNNNGGGPTNSTPPGGGNTGTTAGGNPGTDVAGSALGLGELAGPFRSPDPGVAAAGTAPDGTELAPASIDTLPVALPSLSGGGSPLARTGFPAQAVVFIGVFLLLAGRSVAGVGRGAWAWRRR